MIAEDCLLKHDGSWSVVSEVETVKKAITAYNLTVAEFHTYYVAENVDEKGVWDHNCSDVPKGAKNSTEPNRIYSARELNRRAEKPRTNSAPNPNHDFPESFNAKIYKGNKTIVSDNYHLYTKPGTLNGRTGFVEIGVRSSASGKTEVITHRFFRQDKK